MGDELEMISENSHGLIEILFRYLPGGTEENPRKPISIADDTASFRSEHLPCTSVERYRQVNLLGAGCCPQADESSPHPRISLLQVY
jgi:hypothetical protein